MKLLISPVSELEAFLAANSEADIVDIKNVREGSLGAQLPLVTRKMVNQIRSSNKESSATLGDLPYKPGTAALAALGLATLGVDYIKAGIYGPQNTSEAFDVVEAVVQTVKEFNSTIKVVAVGYADWRKFGGISPDDLVFVASEAKADIVMVDTAIKDGTTLFDNMNDRELKQFIIDAKNSQMLVGLAGSIKEAHLPKLAELKPDIIGVRGAVCAKGNRHEGIDAGAVAGFIEKFKAVNY